MANQSGFGTELLLLLVSFPLLSGEFVGLGAFLGVGPETLRSVGLFIAGMGIGVAFRKLSIDDGTTTTDSSFGVEWILSLLALPLLGSSVLGIPEVGNTGAGVLGSVGGLLMGTSIGSVMYKLSGREPTTT